MKTPDERLAFLLESGRREIPRGNGRQRALLALDASQTGTVIEPGSARGALTQLREPSTASGFLLKLSVVALLSVATSSMKEHGARALGAEAPAASPLAAAEIPSLASAGIESEASPLEPARTSSTKPGDERAPPVLAVTPSALPPARPRLSSRKITPPAGLPRPASSSSSSSSGLADSLRDELAIVDEASRALAAGRCAQAKQAVDRYGARFPSGRLRDEIDVISVELIGMHGDHASAAARARELLALRPKSPYATRLSRWLATNPGDVGAPSCVD